MNAALPKSIEENIDDRSSWMDQSLSSFWCVISWITSSMFFVALVALLGGPTQGDAVESLYSTIAVAHGRLSCIYPPSSSYHFVSIATPSTFIAPFYPLFSGAVSALLRIGHQVPFPSQAKLGTNCSTAFVAMYNWTIHASTVLPLIRIGYLSWLFLLVGIVALLRVTGRGRTRWEPAALFLAACVPALAMSLIIFFHPQDIIAIGLILCSLACTRRSKWLLAGIFIGLAFTSQQFALLAFAPLLIVAPSRQRIQFLLGALGAAALVILPLIAITRGRATHAAVIGSGFSVSNGGTLVWEAHVHGALLFLVSRLIPIAVAVALAWWASRRLGPRILDVVPLISLIATTLTLRLVFEENLFGYYFLAAAVMILMLDIAQGRLRGKTITWIALATVAFNPIPWGFTSNGRSWGLFVRQQLPIWFALIALVLIIADGARRKVRWYLVVFLVVDALTSIRYPWMHTYLRASVSTWVWQIVLVPTALVLAGRPLFQLLLSSREHIDEPDSQTAEI
jgi:hypothetical protein